MGTDLTLTRTGAVLAIAGEAANEAAASAVFVDYRSRKAGNTVRRQDADLATFAEYLAQAAGRDAPTGEALATDPAAWSGVTWGLVEGFAKWMLLEGYAVGTVNLKLSTVKTYARLAAKAGAVSPQELALIRSVSGYSHREGKRIDDQREQAGIPTRNGDKKAEAVSISRSQADRLKAQPDTPQGRRDALLMGLLLDLGLRVSEVAALGAGRRGVRFRRRRCNPAGHAGPAGGGGRHQRWRGCHPGGRASGAAQHRDTTSTCPWSYATTNHSTSG